jgi:hypothetical protein
MSSSSSSLSMSGGQGQAAAAGKLSFSKEWDPEGRACGQVHQKN